MSRGNGKERMYPEKEGAGEDSPHKRLRERATVANPLLQNPSAVQCTISTCFCLRLEFGDQIWNAFILLTRMCTGSALLFTGFLPMGHQPAVNPPDLSPVQGCTTTIQYTQVSQSLAGNIVDLLNKIRREDAVLR